MLNATEIYTTDALVWMHALLKLVDKIYLVLSNN